MKTYKNIYNKISSFQNIFLAYLKAKKGKSKKLDVLMFEENLLKNVKTLQKELITQTYYPIPLQQFILRDPKTRKISKSDFRDRIVHHALINIIGPIFEKTFIYDSCANQKGKGTSLALKRFDKFKRQVSNNGKLIKKPHNKNSIISYAFKADIKHYFDSIDHEILLNIIRRKIKDKHTIQLIKKILANFNKNKGKGMPLGNLTSQFFANVYLNDLDYFIKHELKIKHYIRYVDDFIITHSNKKILEIYKYTIIKYLKYLKLELHPDKSKIFPLYKGVNFLGFRCFYYHKLLRKKNLNHFYKRIAKFKYLLKNRLISQEKIIQSIQGWFAYAMQGNTHNLRKRISRKLDLFI
jgi:RNA-directed DNA polymerase